ncbi:hypothetical protein D9615_004431 [Tricholomella constricta]|uniref:Zn(2)-C6 fungal-type domain-containing protein n=1 Tax=Tricholomella constricta TaxID=117010 RepID=A0A8H5HEX9_9AGAR|nr:hypothetical protein D9615_004431 [Tricholomella constricta]
MPSVKSSPSSRRGGTKAKGATRNKTGCYTCRIRRKKCDEERDDVGNCMTCVRLRVECLGYGAKRPQWLRESRNVTELRERIKVFLAAQGMIKGHSGSATRGVENEQPLLRLSEEYSESSASPPTPTLSLSSDTIRDHHNVSSIRDDHDATWSMDAGFGQASSLFPNSIRDDSPLSSQGSAHDHTSYQLTTTVDTPLWPALMSSFSRHYHSTTQADEPGYEQYLIPEYPIPFSNPSLCTMEVVDQMVEHYKRHVVSVQYLFADDNVRHLICDTVSSHGRSREAASLLASVHFQRFRHPALIAFESEDTKNRLRELWTLLQEHHVGSGDAMAALHVVSSYLFDGGRGSWDQWLHVSYKYVDHLFSKHGNPTEALLYCSKKDAFIIKTSIWFDVLASVTTQKSPHFLEAIRVMFGPDQSRIYEVSHDQASMMSPMGCHNEVLWALAETSHLSAWKKRHAEKGSLSMPTLLRLGMDIDQVLSPPLSQVFAPPNIQGCRDLAAEIFRSSARLYLRAVLSGDHPHVPEIMESVQDTIDCMKRLYDYPDEVEVNGQRMSRSVVRNTVFSFFICGAFAEKEEHRRVILALLEKEGDDGAGNCGTIQAPMVPLPDDIDSPSQSARGTPNRHPIDLPRIPSASKGGCWTCRLRRKKCDEQREGDSCKTCRRLTINCLGWGPKRPEWMRDKQAVEAYKANIKAQLTRAGLIRGQPRASLSHQTPAPMSLAQMRPRPYHRASAPNIASSSPLPFDHEYGYRYVSTPQEQHHRQDHSLIPGMPGASNSTPHQITDPLYTDANALDLHTTFFPYPQSVTPISSSSSLSTDLGLDFAQLGTSQEQNGFEFDLRPPSPPAPVPFIAGQNNVQGDHVIYYFEHVRKIQLIFAGNTFTNATYSIILQEPRGAVTNAVCALASLHYTRMRVAQGLEAPDPNPEHSNATYFHDEAYFQLETAKQLRGAYTESEAVAALHLVCYSQLSGGTTGWQPAFVVMCEWLTQTGLLTDENAAITLHTMSTTAQLLVKATLWLDTFSSLTLVRPPKYIGLLKRLLGERGGYWPAVGESDGLHSLRMDLLTGCPDEVMLAIAEIMNLAYWKATEQRNGTLSFRELVRRGDDIEQRLRKHRSKAANLSDVDQAPLHPNLQASTTEPRLAPFPGEEARRLVAKIFCETVVLSLHTVLSNANPGVAEIRESVETIVRLLHQLTSSEIDRALVFPICLAGSMSDVSAHRDFCKGRLQHLDGSIGNLMQTRLVMEAVWQKRDVKGGPVDFRDTIRERGLNLLLI